MKSTLETHPPNTNEISRIIRHALISALLWTLLLAGLFASYVVENRKLILEIGRSMAQASFEKDLLFRRWAARSGGVYVPETVVTPANPYLSHIPERNIITPSGRQLTLVNPAYMTRQVFELARENPDTPQGHITSLKPIRPENAPDAWETQALNALERGAKEVVEPVLLGGKPHLRIMRQLVTEKTCLRCHAAQGYLVGDIRGGISETISLTSIQKVMNNEMQQQAFIYLFIWLIGLGSIWLVTRKIIRTKQLLQKEQNLLREVKQMYETLFNLSPEILALTTEKDGRYLAVNSAHEQATGYSAEEMIGHTSTELGVWEVPAERRHVIEQLREQGTVHGAEVNFRRRSGEEFPALLSIARIDMGGEPCMLKVVTDITALKRAEEEKHALEQQLHQAQKMESLGVLAGGIAHDFNNILAVIMCYSSLGQQQPEKAAEFMPEIEKASERAAGLCRQMLAYAGKTQFVQSKVDMTALVGDILGMLKSTLPQNVNIKSYLTGDLPAIEGDASQLRQIVMNMMINASEAIGEERGDIRVALAKRTIVAEQNEKDHLGNAIAAGSYLCLEVTDSGCGMDDETQRRIFEPFFTTKFLGRGLGMSALLGVVTSHKGALQLTSQLEQGSTFKVYFPVQDGDTTAETAQQADQSAWQGSGTILLVEDEAQLIEVAKALLEMLGFKVIEATNGVEALEQYRRNSEEITLVLTDIGMPLMNGYKLIAELKKIKSELPIIVSSGFGDSILTSKIAPGDIVGGISKPYRFEQLRDVLRGVVEALPEQG